MTFHCLVVKNTCMRVHSCSPFFSHLPLGFLQNVCWAGLLEGPWWPDGFSRGCLLFSLNLYSFTLFFLSKTIITVLSSFVDSVLVIVYIFLLLSLLFYSSSIYIFIVLVTCVYILHSFNFIITNIFFILVVYPLLLFFLSLLGCFPC